MPNFEPQRKQLRIEDERQILRPSELYEGASIAVLRFFPGASRKERLMQAAYSLTGAIGDQTNGRVKAAKQGWRHFGLLGIAPMLSGKVEAVDSSKVWIEITAEPENLRESLSLVGAELEDLPTLEIPTKRTMLFSELGLTAILPIMTGFRPEIPTYHVGKWEPRATILLPE